jgi:phosphosulfolactate phosphohydrolase-like enzyme
MTSTVMLEPARKVVPSAGAWIEMLCATAVVASAALRAREARNFIAVGEL